MGEYLEQWHAHFWQQESSQIPERKPAVGKECLGCLDQRNVFTMFCLLGIKLNPAGSLTE